MFSLPPAPSSADLHLVIAPFAAFFLLLFVNGEEPATPMKASLQKQRESARKQIRAITGAPDPDGRSWFQYPWNPDPLGPPIEFDPPKAQCEPMALDKVNPLIEAAAKREGVSADLVRAVMEQESALRPCAVSSKGAQGLMQLMPSVQQEFGVRDPFDPAQSIDAGTRYLKQLLGRYKGNLDLVLAAYNAGPARVDKDGGVPAIPETKQYVEAVRKKLPAAAQP